MAASKFAAWLDVRAPAAGTLLAFYAFSAAPTQGFTKKYTILHRLYISAVTDFTLDCLY